MHVYLDLTAACIPCVSSLGLSATTVWLQLRKIYLWHIVRLYLPINAQTATIYIVYILGMIIIILRGNARIKAHDRGFIMQPGRAEDSGFSYQLL